MKGFKIFLYNILLFDRECLNVYVREDILIDKYVLLFNFEINVFWGVGRMYLYINFIVLFLFE